MDDRQAFDRTLQQMGVRLDRVGRSEATLPPIPRSDPEALQRNLRDGFYDVGAREYWGKAEIVAQRVEDFPKCGHYFVQKANGETICTQCHAGWRFPQSFSVKNGKLYKNEQSLQFAH